MVTKIYTPYKERIFQIIIYIIMGLVAFFIGIFLSDIALSHPGPYSWIAGLPGALLGLGGLFFIIIEPLALLLGYDLVDDTYYAPPGSLSPSESRNYVNLSEFGTRELRNIAPQSSESQDDANLEEIAEGELRNRGM